MKATTLLKQFKENAFQDRIIDLYEDETLLNYQQSRYCTAIGKFIDLYGDLDVEVYSVPGRSEVGGNHTDHQHGRVLAASVNLDAIAIVAKDENVVKVVSDNFDIKEIDICDLDKKDDEKATSEALIRGVLAGLKKEGANIGGFKAYITSDVLIGAGLSSSAAFEVMIGTIVNGLYNDMSVDKVTIAKIGQFAENVYFEKPCGLMDQCACSVGSLISIDFNDPASPIVSKMDVDFSQFNHSLCIVDTKGSHADLTDEYAAVPAEMKEVAALFGKQFLRDVDVNEFFGKISDVREKTNDRAVLRAIHFFEENERVVRLVAALNNKDFDNFKREITNSGNSSYKYLQNVFSTKDVKNQSVSIALAMSEHILQNHGVCRVHGGGFAGTIQAFVENGYVDTYKAEIEKVFGKDSCHVLKIRKYGGVKF
ncbi:MAG: galactokinase [Erysipelotrichaceae bacterium]|nr:galactokinase [Erysipelotrichaceae bacterium]